jgi:cystathionine beta-lyase/cystathionine gamma-synthase
MKDAHLFDYIKDVLKNMPKSWLGITTHRLDIYNEEQAKTEFLTHFEALYQDNNVQAAALSALPTAYDYIRLGHPLSCVLEWAIARINAVSAAHVMSFSSATIPILAILRTNSISHKKTRILYTDALPSFFNATVLREVYGYQFELEKISELRTVTGFDGSTVFITQQQDLGSFNAGNPKPAHVDFSIDIHATLGSVLMIHGTHNASYIAPIQHVRRRESIAMTPVDSLAAIHILLGQNTKDETANHVATNKTSVLSLINDITGTTTTPLVGSSGLSIQYAIMMGLIHDAVATHKGKAIKIVVPPNCYGGTNDQARRIAAAINNVEIVDLLVDGDDDMIQSIDTVLTQIANDDAIPYVIAEIPTNPRVEVPDLERLKAVLSKERKTAKGSVAIDPVFVLDQTFCPNVQFLGENQILSTIRTISFASGSKFPSGGKCTAGYCVGNEKTKALMDKIALHLDICDNEATPLQYEILAAQMPSMNQRIHKAYKNTREFANFIQVVLPEAKINFVSEELAAAGFTPSVFSLDLPTKGNTPAEKETHKRALNLQLINLMIAEIPDESKFCVSYGQLKGCYWTIPATSTQGTTKESDKDYIVRASLSPNIDLEMHKRVFLRFVERL